ncbi:hypothetical protein [Nocardioides mesophilus]|uniref:Peptidylprolyl isomerase n=1 Tax=Nocardioides mesophilus TaxID=433659 RepID=A0A7G9RA94_9ACTN|nr:hypothetical protein [Nocardioides mesophilus]QNN52519.1 hypothetical protein H9L09_18965 [Nocardioides mesophilus]
MATKRKRRSQLARESARRRSERLAAREARRRRTRTLLAAVAVVAALTALVLWIALHDGNGTGAAAASPDYDAGPANSSTTRSR